MKLSDAAQILGLSGAITPEAVKRAYREAALKYHTDHNPAGAEMMKLINAAYETLKDCAGSVETAAADVKGRTYPEAVNEALNAIIGLAGLDIEICGAWVWVGGNTYPHRATLKAAGFSVAGQKKRWYFRPEDWHSTARHHQHGGYPAPVRQRTAGAPPGFAGRGGGGLTWSASLPWRRRLRRCSPGNGALTGWRSSVPISATPTRL